MMKVQAQAAESILAFGDVNDIVQLAIKKHPDSVEDKVEVLKKQYAIKKMFNNYIVRLGNGGKVHFFVPFEQ